MKSAENIEKRIEVLNPNRNPFKFLNKKQFHYPKEANNEIKSNLN